MNDLAQEWRDEIRLLRAEGWLPPDEAEKLRADAEALAEALEEIERMAGQAGPGETPARPIQSRAWAALTCYRRGEHG